MKFLVFIFVLSCFNYWAFGVHKEAERASSILKPQEELSYSDYYEHEIAGVVQELVTAGRKGGKYFSHYLVKTEDGSLIKLGKQYYHYTLQERKKLCQPDNDISYFEILIKEGDALKVTTLKRDNAPQLTSRGVEFTNTMSISVNGSQRFSLTRDEYIAAANYRCEHAIDRELKRYMITDPRVSGILWKSGNIVLVGLFIVYSIFIKNFSRTQSVNKAKQSRTR